MYETKLERFVPPEIEEEVYSYLFEHYRKQRTLNGLPPVEKKAEK
jgi:hypothetical protein